ncbi:alpha/beta-hydrolase [Saccharata proteae CBS 121410]|uniref:Alpha/beta-hydrolase n=1 Tax=Saccharata proteae CBS 121410 TaxID=1314787 RepID=A0A9P4LUB8_9PEZI|nr:alpha/beta-hydrolase [Saccharata proteae CBS 121410]
MHSFFSSPFFNFELTRILGTAPFGGCQISEFLEAVGEIKKHDSESWYRAWIKQAEKAEAFAANSAMNGHHTLAREAYLRASNYFRAAPYMLRFPDPRILPCSSRAVQSFKEATGYFEGQVIELEIPYEDGYSLPGYLFLPPQSKRLPNQKAPVLINCGGADSTKEELYFMNGIAGTELGYAVLLFDGPGQGITLKKHEIYMRPDFEIVIARVLDHLPVLATQHPNLQLDLARTAVAGTSLGAYFALRAATLHSVAACVAIDPFYSMWDLAMTRMPRWYAQLWIDGYIPDSVFNWSCYTHMRVDFPSGWEFSLSMWMMHKASPADLLREFRRYSLRDQKTGEELLHGVTCPVLVAGAPHSVYASPEQSTLKIAKLLRNVPENEKEIWLPQSAGEGSLTGKVGAWDKLAAKTFEFLDKQLGVERSSKRVDEVLQ